MNGNFCSVVMTIRDWSPDQRVGELSAVLVRSGRHNAGGVLELVDRLLELAVEDDAVGDDHDLVEDRPIVHAVERHQPMR